MRYLLDENLDAKTAAAMDAIAAEGDGFAHILTIANEGTHDQDIPALCRQHDFDVLVSVNVKDFGARKLIYQALLDAGVNVIVIRAGNANSRSPRRCRSFRVHMSVRVLFAMADGPAWIRVAAGGTAQLRSLQDLEDEFAAGDRPHLP